MYQIISYDIINGERTSNRILKPVEVDSLSEVDKYQKNLQRRVQKLHSDTVIVFVNYKVLINQHIPWI